MARRKPTTLDDLDALVDAIIVDTYGDDESQTAFLEVFHQDVRQPVSATVLGMPVDVVGFDHHDERRGVVARCRRDGSRRN